MNIVNINVLGDQTNVAGSGFGGDGGDGGDADGGEGSNYWYDD